MKQFNAVKRKISILVVFVMLLQVFMPVFETYAFAEEKIETEALVETNKVEMQNEGPKEAEEAPAQVEDKQAEDKQAEDKQAEEAPADPAKTEDEEAGEEEAEGEAKESSDQAEKEEESQNKEENEKPAEEKDKNEKTEVDGDLNAILESEDEKEELDLLAFELQPKAKREPKKITENIIDKMRLKYKDESEFKDGDVIAIDEDLRFELDWSLLNNYEYISGDYFEFKLPEQITVYNPLDGSLGDYGTYTVDTNGNVKFTFNEKIEEESDIKGTFWFDTELKESTITTTEETIELVVNGEVVQKVIVNVKPTGGQAISKEGQPVDGNFNTAEIEWTVVVNTTRDSLKNAIINDPILAGQELILDSLVLKEVEVDLAGKVTKELDDVTGFTNNSTKENLNIGLGDTNKAYKLTFKTKLLEKDFKEGTTNYENTAYLKSDGKDDAQAGGSVLVSRPKSMEKTSSAFDKKYRSIEWTVKANFNKQSLKAGDLITDEFTFTVDGAELKNVFEIKSENISIEQVDKFNDEGNATETSNAKDSFDITVKGNKVTYKLKEDSNKAFIIKYKTELKDGAYINKDGKITNKVDLNGKTATGSQGVIQQVGKKTNAGINYKDKTIDWTITINADEQDLRNFVLTDSFGGSGQKLVAGSIIIEPEISSEKITPNANEEGFEIIFGDITETYTIKYQTKFSYDFDSNDSNNKPPNFKNGVKISYKTRDGDEYESGFDNTVKPNDQTKKNGAKNGSVDNKTKEITWKVDINYNQLALENAKLTDTIPDNQSLIDGSVKIYETSIAEDGGITVEKDVTDDFTFDTSENQVNVFFGSSKKSYRVEFRTKDKDGIYNEGEVYENTADFIPKEGRTHNLTANVTLPNQGEFIGKTGTHNKEDWTIDWKIDVNKSLSTTSDFTVTDDLGDPAAQILLEDTIKVTKAGSADELVEGEGKDYKLTVEGNGFEIYFPGKITEAYVITYSSYIVAEETKKIKNNAKIQSNDVIKGTTTKTETVEIKISTGGGTGEGTTATGGLVIEKFEADSKRALKDVVFALVKTIGNKEIVVREGTTDADGKLEWQGLQYGEYKLREVIPEGYTGEAEQEITLSSGDPEGIKTFPVENTRKKGEVKIIKVDSNTNETLKGAEFKLVNQTTEQEYTFTTDVDGVILEEVSFGEYTVEEITAPKGYRIREDIPNITVEIGKTATITVENVAYVDVEGQKKWIVDDDKTLPDSITLKLLRNDEETDKSLEVTATDNWKYSFKDLDKYTSAGKEINYDIEEVAIDGYVIEKDGYNLTNIQTTSVSGTKTWKDDDNPERPKSITIQLLANGATLADKPAIVTKDNGWKYEFNNLPKYDAEGKKIAYSIKELYVAGYKSEIDGFDITNTRANIISVKGEKTWKDEDPTDRPESIEVNLTRKVNGEIDKDFSKTQTVKANPKGNWVYEFGELDEFDDKGVAYRYIVKENNVPANYKSSVEGYDIINLRVGKTEVSGTKRWKDDKVEDRPDSITINLLRNNVVIKTKEITAGDNWKYTFTDLDKYDEDGKYYKYTVKEKQVPGYAPEITGNDVTNTRSEKTNFEITKGWLDDDSEDRPASIIVYVYQNDKLFDTVQVKAAKDWVYELSDIEAYDEDGQPYTYTVKEKALEGYKTTVNGFNITNLRVGKTKVAGEKTWVEVDEQYRPDSITVKLLANNEEVNTAEITEGTDWAYAFEDLEKYDENGKEIAYSIKEIDIVGYEAKIEGFNIINTQIKTEVSGEKLWLDDDSPDRPKSITLHLLANEKKLESKTLTVSKESDWKYTFDNLPKFDKEGNEIVYIVEEEAIDGYETTVDGFNLTNLRVGEIEIIGEKFWLDDNKDDRPELIEVVLTRKAKDVVDEDFLITQEVEPDSKGNWVYEFTKLDEFNDKGVAYRYIIEEADVSDKYESSVEGYDITNLRVGKTEVSGTKHWKDDKKEDRPESIKVNLLQNNVVIKTEEVSVDDGWTYIFTDLDEFDENGVSYKYTVKEEQVPGYAPEVSGNDITNTRSEKTKIEITKGWIDDNSQDRPDSITVFVYQNDKLFDTVQVKAAKDWVYELSDIEAYDEDGQPYTYTVKEKPLEGYKTTVNGFNINNLRFGEIEVSGDKIWKDQGPTDRPESIELTLTRKVKGVLDESFSKTQIVKPDSRGEWKYSFKHLAEFDENGVKWDYTVDEVDVDGYKKSSEGNNLINTRVGITEVKGSKIWKGGPSKKPTIELQLFRNGLELGKAIELQDGESEYTWMNLDKYDENGKEYKYSIDEVKVPSGYTKLISDDGLTITNSYKEPVDPPKDPTLPQTGAASTTIPYGIALFSLLLGVFLRRKE